jgi:hypothetical protein
MQRRKTTEIVHSRLIHEIQQVTRPILFFKFRFAASYILRRAVDQLYMYVNLHSIVLIHAHFQYRPIVIVLPTC